MLAIRIICPYCKKITDCGLDKAISYKTPQPFDCANEDCGAYLCEAFEIPDKELNEELV